MGVTRTSSEPSSETTSPRRLPSVDAVLRAPDGQALVARFGHSAGVEAVRACLAEARAGGETRDVCEVVARAEARLVAQDRPALRPVYNLTGTVLHTNLGRAILAEEAIEAAVQAMRHVAALEYDLASGKRGERDDLVRDLICALTGAEDATLVNNNASAVLLSLNALAEGKGAIVSRGELIEIGGAFRMPDIMARAGVRLVEVGTTNRTHLRDYENAIDVQAGVIMKVHTSNYRIEGFTAAVPAARLAELAHAHGLPLLDDLGSGTLVDLARFGLAREPTVGDAIRAGADVVTFSGDKLLGGPQAGFIVGRRDLIARINRNPLKRALRVDKIRLAAIEATLKLYRDPDRLAARLPTMRALARLQDDIRAQAERLAPGVADAVGPQIEVTVVTCSSQVGSGAVPVETMASAGLSLRPTNGGGAAVEALAAALRALPMPVIGRIADGAVLLDLRCLTDDAAFLANLAGLAS